MAFAPKQSARLYVRDTSDPKSAKIKDLKSEFLAKWRNVTDANGAIVIMQNLEQTHQNSPDNVILCYETLLKCSDPKSAVALSYSLLKLYEGRSDDEFAAKVLWLKGVLGSKNVDELLRLIAMKYAKLNEQAGMINNFVLVSFDAENPGHADAIALTLHESLNKDVEAFHKVLGSVRVSAQDRMKIVAQYKESPRLQNVLKGFIAISVRIGAAPELTSKITKFILEYNEPVFVSRYLEQLVELSDNFGISHLMFIINWLDSDYLREQLGKNGPGAYWTMVDSYMMDEPTIKALNERRAELKKENKSYPYYPNNHFTELYNMLAEVYQKPQIRLRK